MPQPRLILAESLNVHPAVVQFEEPYMYALLMIIQSSPPTL
jgi:hypothetical protein